MPREGSLEEARDALARYPDFDTVGYGRWGCVLNSERRVIGFCGLKYLADLDAVDVGYRFLPEYWGRGLATEACRASVQFGFDVLQLERIIGLVVPENSASIRVLEMVGMRLDGMVDYEGERVLRYSVTRGEVRGRIERDAAGRIRGVSFSRAAAAAVPLRGRGRDPRAGRRVIC